MEFYANTDLVLIGTNPELSNFDNPRGEIYGWQSYVTAEASNGARTRVAVRYSDREIEALQPAVRLADALNARLKLGRLPVGFRFWERVRPVYGSEAYIASGSVEDLEREFKDEMT